MDIRNPKALKSAAYEALEHCPDHRKTVLVWAGITLGISFLVSLLNFLLDGRIGDTGGLSGIGMRSILSTAQSVLTLGGTLLIPFWELGYTSAVLGFARKRSAHHGVLLSGFRRFGPALRLLLLKYLIFMAVTIFGFYSGAMVMAVTPLATPLYAFIQAHPEMELSYNMDPVLAEEMLGTMIPILIGCGIVCFALLIPIYYRLRLTDYLVMDQQPVGALVCILSSFRLMHRNRLALLRLDLSFWWFYLMNILSAVLCYGDLLLKTFGVALPINADITFFAFYIASLLAQFAILYFHGNRVYTTYATFYDTLFNPTVSENHIPE